MPRPPLVLGTWGEMRTYVVSRDGSGKAIRHRAVTNYRDYDGRTRQVERCGKTETAAKNALRAALKERTSVSRHGELSRSHRFSVAAELWMNRVVTQAANGARSPGTVDTYRRQLDRHVLPALGGLRLGEITTSLLDRFIGTTAREVGSPTARTCRSIVSGVLGLAVRYGALTANPVREVDRIEGRAKREPRALTAVERAKWMAQLLADDEAVRKDLPDLCQFLLAASARIGEALAMIWSDVDFGNCTVSITSTLIRVKGVGLVRKDTKSSAGQRVLVLPSWAMTMLQRRFTESPSLAGPVFPDALGGFRDPNNVRRDLRNARGSDGFAWVTSHHFRKTAATILDDAGLSSRVIADQLGHSRPSLTQDVYMGRKQASGLPAAALERAWDSGSKE